MARQATGAITITDITDGTSPITALLTNENHTFIASELGVVSSADRLAFESNVIVFVGSTQAPFDGAAVPANNTYKLGTFVLTDTNWSLREDNVTDGGIGVRRIRVVDSSAGVPDTATNVEVDVNVPVIITNNAGGTNTITLRLALRKAIAGAGGVIIQFTPDKQTFIVDENGLEVGTQTLATVQVDYQGAQGNRTITSSVNGGAFTTAVIDTTDPITAGSLATLDILDPEGNDNFTLEIENFLGTTAAGVLLTTTNTVSYRVASAGGGNDVVSFAKVQNGDTGAGALIVVVEAAGGTTFKNSTGTRTLTTKIYDAATGTEIENKVANNASTRNITYTWYINDTDGNEVRVDTGTRDVKATSGTPDTTGGDPATGTIDDTSDDRFDQIIVEAADITTTQQFTCLVDVST